MNKKDGILSKSDSTIKECARKPGQKSLTSVNVNQDQSNEIEMEDEAKDLFVHMRMTEEEEAIKAFSMYNIHKQFSCIMLIIYF